MSSVNPPIHQSPNPSILHFATDPLGSAPIRLIPKNQRSIPRSFGLFTSSIPQSANSSILSILQFLLNPIDAIISERLATGGVVRCSRQKSRLADRDLTPSHAALAAANRISSSGRSRASITTSPPAPVRPRKSLTSFSKRALIFRSTVGSTLNRFDSNATSIRLARSFFGTRYHRPPAVARDRSAYLSR